MLNYLLVFILLLTPIAMASSQPPSQTAVISNRHVRLGVVPLLTLKEAILLAMRMNPDVHNAELQRVVDKFSVAVARNQFYPQLSFTSQALYQNDSKSSYAAIPGLSWATPLGSTISTAIVQNVNNNTKPAVSSGAQLAIAQPLLRGFGPAVNKVSQLDTLDAEKNNQLAFKGQIMDMVVAVVSAYYLQVQAHNDLQVNQLQLKDAQLTLAQTTAKVQVGKAAKADAVQQQAQIAELQLAMATDQSNIDQANQNLLNLLGLDPQARVRIDETIASNHPPLPNLEQSIAQALVNNISYQQALNSFRIMQRAVVSAKDAQQWQLDAVVNLNQRLSQNTGTVPTLSKSLSLNLNIPVHDMPRRQQLIGAKVAVEQAKASLEQTKRRLITDVTNAYNNLQFSSKQIELYRHSIKLAQQSLAIAKIKFNYGKATPFELVSLQTNLTQTELKFTSQQIDYLTAIEAFYRLLGTTLLKWGLTLAY